MRFRQVGDGARARYYVDGKQVTKEEHDRAMQEGQAALPQVEPDPELDGNRPWSRPVLSQALAYHARQVPEAREHFRKLGLDPEKVRNDGRVEMSDLGGKRQILKKLGMHDNNCYN
jgi:hypothetical protein